MRRVLRSCVATPSSYCLDRVNVAVAVAEYERARLHQVTAKCRALGFNPTCSLIGVGVIVGSVKLDRISRLRAIPGVIAVELERQPRANVCRAVGPDED
jgi:hypothetical protein